MYPRLMPSYSKLRLLHEQDRLRRIVDGGLRRYTKEYGAVTRQRFENWYFIYKEPEHPIDIAPEFIHKRLLALEQTGVLVRIARGVYYAPVWDKMPSYYQVGMAHDPRILSLFFQPGTITAEIATPKPSTWTDSGLPGLFRVGEIQGMLTHDRLPLWACGARILALARLGVLCNVDGRNSKSLHPDIFMPFNPDRHGRSTAVDYIPWGSRPFSVPAAAISGAV